MKVNSLQLSLPFCYKLYVIPFDLSIWLIFHFVHPLRINGTSSSTHILFSFKSFISFRMASFHCSHSASFLKHFGSSLVLMAIEKALRLLEKKFIRNVISNRAYCRGALIVCGLFRVYHWWHVNNEIFKPIWLHSCSYFSWIILCLLTFKICFTCKIWFSNSLIQVGSLSSMVTISVIIIL